MKIIASYPQKGRDAMFLFGILAAMAGKDFIGGVHIKTTAE